MEFKVICARRNVLLVFLVVGIEFASGQDVGFVMDKAALRQVFSECFGFPCQSFHQFLHYHNHPELEQQAY
jgi:hypothetical protein